MTKARQVNFVTKHGIHRSNNVVASKLRALPHSQRSHIRQPAAKPPNSSLFSPTTLGYADMSFMDVVTLPRAILTASPREECACFRATPIPPSPPPRAQPFFLGLILSPTTDIRPEMAVASLSFFLCC